MPSGEMKVKTKKSLPKMLRGSICAQMVRCGRANCKCIRGELHGPYHYHFYRFGKILRKRYVPACDVAEMLAACAAWRQRTQDLRRKEQRERRRLRTARDLLKSDENLVAMLDRKSTR